MELIQRLEAFRDRENLKKADMARLLGVPAQNYNNWVYRNSLPKSHIERAREILRAEAPSVGGEVRESESSYIASAQRAPYVSVITYGQAASLNSGPVHLQVVETAERVATNIPHSKETVAIRVEGHAMTLPPGIDGMSFPPGILIFVDLQRSAAPGDLVLARCGDSRVTFRKLALEEGHNVLVPLNPDREQYPVMRGDFVVMGRVFEASYGGF